MELKYSNPFPLLAGILFGLSALLQLFLLMGYTTLWNLVALAGYCCLAAVALLQRRDLFTAGAGALAALGSLVALFQPYATPLLSLLDLLAYLAAALLALTLFTGYLPTLDGLAPRLWFLPAAIGALSFVVHGIYAIPLWVVTGRGMGTSVLLHLLAAGALFFLGAWMVYPQGFPRSEATPQPQPAEDGVLPVYAYCGLLKHTLLLVFTFGVWHLIWIYRTTGHLNALEDEPLRNPTTKLLLCLFIPFYQVYWSYQSAQRVDRLAREAGLLSDLTLPCLLLSLAVPILSAVLLQEKINHLVDTSLLEPGDPLPRPAQDHQAQAEALRTYKALLDEGVLTPEEFTAKKRQILEL